jgi:hypothetical protein
MASCYLCGGQIPRGQAFRKHLYTGFSIAGFNFSSNVFLNLIINGILTTRLQRLRSYYPVKTLCGQCATTIAAAEKRQSIVLLMGAILSVIIALVVIVASNAVR